MYNERDFLFEEKIIFPSQDNWISVFGGFTSFTICDVIIDITAY